MSSFNQELFSLEADLKKVRLILLNLLNQAPNFIKDDLKILAEGEGKALRPALLLTAALDKGLKPSIYEAAAAIELLHTASLIHDDILDGAQFRRGHSTLNKAFGPQRAVLYGDLLFTTCFHLLTTAVSPDTAKGISKIMGMMVAAEILQNQDLFQLPTSLRSCLRKTMGKTAALFSLALFVGAQESGSGKETSELLRRVGYHLGMAFQLQDDLLDFFPENNQKGKPAFWDLCHGIYTLPVLFALKADPSLGPLVSECRTPGQGANLVSFIASSGGFKKTKEIADGHYIRALALLERIPQGETKQKLTIIIKKMMERRV